MPDMQNRYGTSSGLFRWGELTNRRYNPSDFFKTGSNVINSVAFSISYFFITRIIRPSFL